MIFDYILFAIVTFAVSIFVNFLNRDDKRLPWKNVFTFATVFAIIFCGGGYVLSII